MEPFRHNLISHISCFEFVKKQILVLLNLIHTFLLAVDWCRG